MRHYHFDGILAARHNKQHLQHRFMVPAGCAALEVDFRFAPAGAQGLSHLITLTLFDPAGFRGAGHRDGAAHRVHIAAEDATPGYLAGPLPAGEWIVQLDTHRIVPGEPVRYGLDVVLAAAIAGENTSPPAPPLRGEGSTSPPTPPLRGEGSTSPPAPPLRGEGSVSPPSLSGKGVGGLGGKGAGGLGETRAGGLGEKGAGGLGETRAGGLGERKAAASRGAGWYRGDLHTHTVHSDAEGLSVADLLAMARRVGLDFVFLTDHNTTAGHAEMDTAAGSDLLPAAGLELTTFWGHAVCLGTRHWVDWRIHPGTGEMARIAQEIYAEGQVFIIAHPQSPGDPCCTGCAWRFGDMMPGHARLVEIWNGPWAGDSGNEAALALWYDWLNQGYRLVATAGSDTHAATDYDRRPGFNVVYAGALDEAALLKALLAGHLYLSVGPRVNLEARDAGGEARMMGDTVAGPAEFTLTWADCPTDARIRVIANGMLMAGLSAAPGAGAYTWRMTPDDADWVLVEIRNPDGQMLAITNPIFIG